MDNELEEFRDDYHDAQVRKSLYIALPVIGLFGGLLYYFVNGLYVTDPATDTRNSAFIDTDADGIADHLDQCVNEQGTLENLGCLLRPVPAVAAQNSSGETSSSHTNKNDQNQQATVDTAKKSKNTSDRVKPLELVSSAELISISESSQDVNGDTGETVLADTEATEAHTSDTTAKTETAEAEAEVVDTTAKEDVVVAEGDAEAKTADTDTTAKKADVDLSERDAEAKAADADTTANADVDLSEGDAEAKAADADTTAKADVDLSEGDAEAKAADADTTAKADVDLSEGDAEAKTADADTTTKAEIAVAEEAAKAIPAETDTTAMVDAEATNVIDAIAETAAPVVADAVSVTSNPAPDSDTDTELTDSDGDGVIDTNDACPNRPGNIDARGCPPNNSKTTTDAQAEPDTDAIADVATTSGVTEAQPVTASAEKLIQDAGFNIQFNAGNSVLIGNSRKVLLEVAKVMERYPEIQLEAHGFTDALGSASINKQLSHARAQACIDVLYNAGIDRIRLKAIGFGEVRPIATNKTSVGRQKNRRVEFKLVR